MQKFEAGGAVLLNSKYEYYMPKSVHCSACVPSAVMGVAQLSLHYYDIVGNNYV
jgi:hypothetical protein